jgi:hypothetical protein
LSSREKLIEAMKINPKDVSFEEINALLIHSGCTRRQPRSGSSHYFYTHPAISEPVNIPKARPIKAIYVKRALRMIDEIKEALANE